MCTVTISLATSGRATPNYREQIFEALFDVCISYIELEDIFNII